MTIKPFQSPSTDQAVTTLVQQLNLMKDQMNAYTAGNDILIGILTDESMQSTKLITTKTSTGRDFVGLKNGSLVGVL